MDIKSKSFCIISFKGDKIFHHYMERKKNGNIISPSRVTTRRGLHKEHTVLQAVQENRAFTETFPLSDPIPKHPGIGSAILFSK